MNIKQLYKQISQLQENVELTIEGWIISNRGNDKIRFITINDGSTIANMQLVVKGELASKKEISEIAMGSAVSVIGKLHLTPEAMQPFELSVSKFLYINNPQEDFPIQKKETSLDF